MYNKERISTVWYPGLYYMSKRRCHGISSNKSKPGNRQWKVRTIGFLSNNDFPSRATKLLYNQEPLRSIPLHHWTFYVIFSRSCQLKTQLESPVTLLLLYGSAAFQHFLSHSYSTTRSSPRRVAAFTIPRKTSVCMINL